jgi:putative chitobiose transport system substrate-binding protein
MFAQRLSLLSVAALVVAACAPPATPAPSTPETIIQTQVVEATVEVEVPVEVVVTATPGPNPEAVIAGVEDGAEITFWTFFLSPTFDEYIQNTIARFNEAYPGVTVNWEDRQGTLQEEYRNSLAAGNAPDVVNIPTDWVPEFAQAGQLINMSESLPEGVRDQWFPGLFEQATVDGASYQAPWYQALDIYLINTQLLDQAGLTPDDLPTDVYDLTETCRTIVEATNVPCGLRVANIINGMIYEAGSPILSEDGSEYVFNTPESVRWLEFYQQMVSEGLTSEDILLDNDRLGLDQFIAGQVPFYVTGPQLIREVRSGNPGLYGYLAVRPQALGVSQTLPPVSMSIVVSEQTQYPNASLALASFFTNAQSMLEFSKIVSIFPSTPASYEDPFFTQPSVAIEDSGRPLAEGIISTQRNLAPEIPNRADVDAILREMFEEVVIGGADPQTALDAAVAEANETLP